MFDRIPPPLRAPILGVGLGLVAGGFEVVALAATSRLHLSAAEGLQLGLAVVGLGGLVGAVLGGVAGLGLAAATRSMLRPARHAAGMAATAGLLAWWYLTPLALDKFDQDLLPAGIAFLLTPVGVVGVTWFNAHYWFRREDLGERRRFGWWAVSLLAGAVLGLGGGWSLADRDYGSPRALEGDPAVLLVTVDGLRADVVDGDGPHPLPVLRELAEEGVVYTNAVTPMPDTLGAHGAVFTGRHPVRLDLVEPDARLAWGYRTLTEILDDEGYATGAFVSRRRLAARSGLSQGFEVYDDDLLGGLVGLSAARPVAVALPLLDPASARRRADADTVARAASWMRAAGPKPFFAWVHLAGPLPAVATGDAATYARAVAELEGPLVELIAEAGEASGEAPLVVVVAGTHGGLLGEHGAAGTDALWDEVVAVPLVIVPHKLAEKTRVVPQQVRLMDVPATLLDLLRLDPMEHSEGADLLAFAEGLRTKHFSTLLVARGDDRTLLGYRAATADEQGNIKFIVDGATGAASLYDLTDDPDEHTDIAVQQEEAVSALRARVEQEAGSLLR